MNKATLNLDRLAARASQGMVEEVKKNKKAKKSPETLERLVTKTLGVLQEQGVYAMMLFLFSRSGDEEKIAPVVRGQLFDLLKKLPTFADNSDVPKKEADAKMTLTFFSDKILDHLDTLLLVRDLYEQTLIYTRYGAKAAKEG